MVTLVTPDQRDEVAGLLRKAGVAASDVAVTPDSPELVRITGARQPSGPALPPFGQQPPARDTHARGAHGAHGGGKGGARRNHRGRRNPRNQHGGRGRRDVGNRRKRQGGS